MTTTETPIKAERWTFQWKELFSEVITSGLCTGCAGCVISCPHDVIGYDHEAGGYKPFHIEDELGPTDCGHGQKGCTSCTRACPRFRAWEPQANEHLFDRDRADDEVAGIYSDILLTRASDDMVHRMGQDGGLVSALLIWALENDYIDGALTSYLEGGDAATWKAIPGVATTRDEVLAGAGSRYTYSANTLALDEAKERGLSRLAVAFNRVGLDHLDRRTAGQGIGCRPGRVRQRQTSRRRDHRQRHHDRDDPRHRPGQAGLLYQFRRAGTGQRTQPPGNRPGT